MATLRRRSLLLSLLIGMLTFSANAQSFDYDLHPKLDFDFKKLTLELGLQPQNLMIDGAATYQVSPRIEGADTLLLHTAHMEISSVSVNGQEAEYGLQNDSLLIPFPEPAQMGESYKVRVRYSSDTRFGLLKNYNGTVWSSQLPKAQRHWIPIFDNPNVTLQTAFNISVPAAYTVWASGAKVGEEAVNENVTTYRFASEKALPATDLALTIGKFKSQSATYGIKKINMAVEQALADQVNAQQILRLAHNWLGKVESKMQSEFPYSRLNIVAMADHSWETKSWGASTIYLYQNRGSMEQQLLRGIIGQWIGAKQRAARWSQADAITLYQTLLQQSLTDSVTQLSVQDQPSTNVQSVYSRYGPARWNAWQKKWKQWKGQTWGSIISEAHPEINQALLPVISWSDYANYWYQHSGQPLFDIPQLDLSAQQASARSTASADSVVYRVDYQLDRAAGQIVLNFKAVQGNYDELVTLPAFKVYPDRTGETEVTFTGMSDSITLPMESGLRTLQLTVPQNRALKLKQKKPVPFLLFELRNAESVQQQVSAARGLGMHTSNPDLQLAINDALADDHDPRVRAALLTSLSDITRGAAGTQQIFLDALKNNNPVIRKAALKGLRYYPDNESVVTRVKQITLSTQEPSVYRQGLEVLDRMLQPSAFQSFVAQVTQQDSVGQRAVWAIQQLARQGESQSIVDEITPFLDESYSYSIRKTALQILIAQDTSAQNWLARGRESLGEASDPRIRYWVVQGMLKYQNDQIISFLEEYLGDEYDARVYTTIEQGLR